MDREYLVYFFFAATHERSDRFDWRRPVDGSVAATEWGPRLTGKQLLARTVTIKVRYDDFTTITRSHTAAPSRDEADLAARAVRLLEKTDAGRRPVRLLGVSVHNFCGEEAPEDPERLPFGV